MNEFAVLFKPSARKELEALPDRLLQRLFPKIEALVENPRPLGYKKLRHSSDLWRLRIGNYRVVYSIDEDESIIEVLRVRHRRDVYD